MTQSNWVDDEAAGPDSDVDSPADRGWAAWVIGRCSITRCLEEPIAAIERTMRRGRAPYWQPYCAEHAHMRGVQLSGGELVWTAEFLAPPARRVQR